MGGGPLEAGAGTALASLLAMLFPERQSHRQCPGAEQDLDIFKGFLERVLYNPSHLDLLLPPHLLSCGLFPGSSRTGRHGGCSPWEAQRGGKEKGNWLHPPLPTPILVLTLAFIFPLRP